MQRSHSTFSFSPPFRNASESARFYGLPPCLIRQPLVDLNNGRRYFGLWLFLHNPRQCKISLTYHSNTFENRFAHAGISGNAFYAEPSWLLTNPICHSRGLLTKRNKSYVKDRRTTGADAILVGEALMRELL
jgi:hypothetical protein